MKTLRRNIPVVVALCALAAVTAVAAIAQTGTPTNDPGDAVAQVTQVPADAADAASVLEEHRTASDAIPGELADQIDEQANFGVNPDLSRRSIGGIRNSVYLVPGRDHVCATMTLAEGANLSCTETDDLAAGQAGPSTVLLESGAIAIYGMVPDGVESVSIAAGAASTTVDAVDNAYMAVVPAGTPVESVSYDGPSGHVEFPLYDPADPEAETGE